MNRCMSCLLVGTHSRTCPDLAAMTGIMPSVTDRTMVMEGGYGYSDEVTVLIMTPGANDRTAWIDPDHTIGFTGVVEGAQIAAQASTSRAPVSPWWLVLLMLGFVLMAIGLFLRDPVALWIWEASR